MRSTGVTLGQLRELSRGLACALSPGSVVFVYGEVGVGKTTLCRGIVEELTDQPFQGSPTFPVICVYDCPGYQLYHIDLYRISSVRECDELGLSDLLAENVLLIEWPEILGETIKCNIRINITANCPHTRNIEVEFL